MSSCTSKSGWCIPLVIFTVLVVFHAIQLLNQGYIGLVGSEFWFFVIALAIGVFIYQLCKCGHNYWAFALVLFPLLIYIIATYINRTRHIDIGDNL